MCEYSPKHVLGRAGEDFYTAAGRGVSHYLILIVFVFSPYSPGQRRQRLALGLVVFVSLTQASSYLSFYFYFFVGVLTGSAS